MARIQRCRNPTTEVTINFLHKLFARFGVVDYLVSDNGTQFTSGDLKDFCETFQMKQNTIAPYPPRSNGQAESFVDTLKRALKKVRGTSTGNVQQQFLRVYRIKPNANTPSSLPTAEVMVVHKIRSVFDKPFPKQTKAGRTNTVPKRRYQPGEKVFFTDLSGNWVRFKKRVENMIYIKRSPIYSQETFEPNQQTSVGRC